MPTRHEEEDRTMDVVQEEDTDDDYSTSVDALQPSLPSPEDESMLSLRVFSFSAER